MSVASRPQAHPRSNTGIILGAVALLLLIILGIWAYVNTRPETTTVARRDIVVTLPLEGKVVAPPSARADVRSPYRAPVDRVFASVGDRVSRGNVLVELSHPSAQAAYEQTRQELKAAEQAYAEAKRAASAAVTEAEKQLGAARVAERRAREGAAPVPAPAAAETETAVTIREPAVELAQATEARIAAEQALLRAQAERNATLTPYRQRMEAAQAAFKEAQSGRKIAQIRAPIAGTVLALNARPGEEIGADRKKPVATIVDLGELQVHATMDAADAASVQTGAPVTVTLDKAPGQQLEGEVARITTAPDRPLAGERRMAIIEFRNNQGVAKPEMEAVASVRLGQAQDVLAVPADAVDKDENSRPTVAVLRGGRWQEVVVEPGLSNGRYTAIRSGLKEGETVRVTPDLL